MTTEARQASAAARASRLPALVRAMLQGGFYPDRPASVDLRQTHISIVFLAGDFVYKIKKPVRFSFIDASTLERRFEFCRDEVQLNSRLARGIYLGVVPILRRGNSFALGPICEAPVENAVEYAVKMRRLDDAAMLDRRLAASNVTTSTIRAIAKRLAEFHANCSREKSWQYCSAAAVWRTVIGNLEESESFASAGIDRALSERVENFCRRSIRVLWETINERARAGRAPEGHGDLRCEHVCIEDGRIEVIDCVEFSESLRYGDVALDIAFLAMDLERLGWADLSREFVRAYIAVSGDEELATVMPLYKCHRAIVRAKVAALKSEEPEIEGSERERARRSMHEYFALAGRYADEAAPALVVICGRSGTGKSTIARALRERTGFAILNSDRVRKKIAGVGADVHAHAAYGEGIYSARATHATYDTMLREAESA
ncbi:MAG TPA: AAA family ATPase, partial [Candidatus Binataceae bacterium]|nr:AAA family ATPase [Candidatus Binataceae bacterium]